LLFGCGYAALCSSVVPVFFFFFGCGYAALY
jgi:hypothetical protein